MVSSDLTQALLDEVTSLRSDLDELKQVINILLQHYTSRGF